jgi:hypothetical protein
MAGVRHSPQGDHMRILTYTAVVAMLTVGGLAAAPTVSEAQWGYGPEVNVAFPPPPLPIYDQPPIPDYGYIWTPGYWGWDPNYGDYYWVPGTWALPPEEGLLWTPAWWGWTDGLYAFHPGYWGPYIGYYGGIDYGFGYTGYGYQGGYWRGREFFYNRAVNNVRNVRITNVFERPVVSAPRRNRVSFNGGVGGVSARPTPQQINAMRERHVAPTADQNRHVQMAGSDRRLASKVNHGAPPVTATPRPATFAPRPDSPPPYRPQGGPPPRPAYGGVNPGDRPAPVKFPPSQTARGGYAGYGGAPPSRPPTYPVARPPVFHPPTGNPTAAAPPPPPRQPPPPQVVRPPSPPPQHSGDPKNKSPH